MKSDDIYRAFSDVPRPHAEEIISQAYDRTEAEFAKALARMQSRGVPEWFWSKYWHEVSLLEEKALHYYLPSLLVALGHEIDQGGAEGRILHSVINLLYSDGRWGSSLRGRLTEVQLGVISEVVGRLRSLGRDYLTRDDEEVLRRWSSVGAV